MCDETLVRLVERTTGEVILEYTTTTVPREGDMIVLDERLKRTVFEPPTHILDVFECEDGQFYSLAWIEVILE